MNQTHITVLLFSLIFLFGASIEDRCAKHSTNIHYNLTECPSSETFNLLECYDAYTKATLDDYTATFWCWSRKDVDEKTIKNVSISTAHVEDDDLIAKINQPFSTQFTFNGTHLKCDTMEKWATESIFVNSEYSTMICVTSTISVATFQWCNPLAPYGCFDMDLNGL